MGLSLYNSWLTPKNHSLVATLRVPLPSLATIGPLTLYAPYSEVTTARSSTQGLRFHVLIRRTQAFQRGNTVMTWAPHAVIRPQSASRSAPAARPWRRRHWQYSPA